MREVGRWICLRPATLDKTLRDDAAQRRTRVARFRSGARMTRSEAVTRSGWRAARGPTARVSGGQGDGRGGEAPPGSRVDYRFLQAVIASLS